MNTILYAKQFIRVENLLNQIHYPFQGLRYYISIMYVSTKLNLSIFFMMRKIHKKMENNQDYKDDFVNTLKKVEKLRNILYVLDKKLEKNNLSGIIYHNIHVSLTRLDDLTEELEIFVDDEIQKYGKKIAQSL